MHFNRCILVENYKFNDTKDFLEGPLGEIKNKIFLNQ